MIQGHGQDSSKIFLVGDSPLKEDLASGKALSGNQERTLRSLFRLAGYDFNFTYRTLFLKDWIDPWGKSRKKKKQELERIHQNGIDYESILVSEIVEFKPNVIVPLGDLSLRFLSGFNPIREYRGSVLPLNPYIQQQIPDKTVRVIPTFSPELLWKLHNMNPIARIDVQKIVRNRDQEGPIENPANVWVCRSASAFNDFLNKQNWAAHEFMTVDIETWHGVPTCIGFCFDGKEAVSIPLFEEKLSYAEGYLLFSTIAKLLASEKLRKVNQNIKYDHTILERFGLRVNNIVGDTVLGFHLLYPELPKNLGFQNSIYTDLPYFKDEAKQKEDAWNPKSYTRDTLYLYNAKDCLATWQIHKKQESELSECGLTDLYRDRIMPLYFIYKEIDATGLRVDTSRRDDLIGKYKMLVDLNTLDLNDIAGEPINSGSPKQVGRLLYENLKFPIHYHTTPSGQKAYSTDKDTLDELAVLPTSANKEGQKGKKVLLLVILIRKLKKLVELLETPLHPGDILKTSYNLAGTKNGRTSAGVTLDERFIYNDDNELVKERLGRSLQTITKHGFEVDGEFYESVGDSSIGRDIRSMFVPRLGKCFIEGDLSQAESRVVAVLAQDYDLLKSHDEKPKIHARTAGFIFGVDPFTVTKDYPQIPGLGMAFYDLGKRARHAFNYRMGDFRLAQMTHLERSQCKTVLTKMNEMNPSIVDVFHFQIDHILKTTAELVNPFGRRRTFFDRYSEKLLKEALAMIPQGTISDRMKFSMIDLKKEAPWASFLVEAHDSLLSEIEIGREEEYCEKFIRCVEQPIDFNSCSLSRDFQLTIPCELSRGENWKEMEEIKK